MVFSPFELFRQFPTFSLGLAHFAPEPFNYYILLCIVASDDWLAIDESLSENLVGTPQDDDSEESSLSSGTASLSITL